MAVTILTLDILSRLQANQATGYTFLQCLKPTFNRHWQVGVGSVVVNCKCRSTKLTIVACDTVDLVAVKTSAFDVDESCAARNEIDIPNTNR